MKIQSAVVYSFSLHAQGADPMGHLRLGAPLRQAGINIVYGVENGEIFPERVSQGDVVILQREFPKNFDQYQEIVATARQQGKPVILDLDDLLFFLPENHPDRVARYYAPSLLPTFQALAEADLVTVPTPFLQKTLSAYNENIVVLPNYFDDSLWRLKPSASKDLSRETVTIGYMGTGTHRPDLDYVTPALLDLIERYPDKIRFHFWGIQPPAEMLSLPQVEWTLPQTFSYPEFAAFFQTQLADIFIAPLVDSLFNGCKSPLKFFEYSALGVPGVFSNLETYSWVVSHGKNGFLASTLNEWTNNLVQLIENDGLRLQLAEAAQATIREKWLLSKNAFRWRDAFQQALEKPLLHGKANGADVQMIKSINPQLVEAFIQKNEAIQVLTAQVAEKEQSVQALTAQVAEKEQSVQALSSQVIALTELAKELAGIKSARSWSIYIRLVSLFRRLFPQNSLQLKLFDLVWKGIRGIYRNGLISFLKKADTKIKSAICRIGKRKAIYREKSSDTYLHVEPVSTPAKFDSRDCPIDIVVCVHNALEDVRRCLESIEKYTNPPYRLILVDDGSSNSTKEYLERFANGKERCTLLRNEQAGGYTRAANKGLKSSMAEFVVLINSDTIVGPEWLDRLYFAITSNAQYGVAGPFSNTASWQSIPKLEDNGDWATNPLPDGMGVEKMSRLIAKYSGMVRPEAKLLNGFCMMIRRAVISDIGHFDEDRFGEGYGEEDDFNLRARKAGWKLVIADDVYIYHAQSKSYSHELRHRLSQGAGEKLREKHGVGIISDSVQYMHPNRVIEGIRARSEVLTDRARFLDQGRKEFARKKVLFVLPIIGAGGGGNVVINEVRCMREMGVDATIFNLSEYREGFLKSYPHLDSPVIYGSKDSLVHHSFAYDAVVATANYSVEWLKPVKEKNKHVIFGYYVQGFEVLMYAEGSKDAERALASYTLIDDMRLFAKTKWVRSMVLKHTGIDSAIVGISINVDLFRPRHTRPFGQKPVAIVAMVRPGSPYRGPKLTMEVLRKIEHQFGSKVEIRLFGSEDIHDPRLALPLDFNWTQAGELTQSQVANLLSDADVFVDFSSHQAMGLTALEAMACGCAVIVPTNGGAVEFVKNDENGLVVDTRAEDNCYQALKRLIEQDALRKNIQQKAILDVCQFHLEGAVYRILETLFRKGE